MSSKDGVDTSVDLQGVGGTSRQTFLRQTLQPPQNPFTRGSFLALLIPTTCPNLLLIGFNA